MLQKCIANKISSSTVQIKNTEGVCLGSGVLWVQSNCSQAYVFTNIHVIDSNDKLVVHYWDSERRLVVTLQVEEVFYPQEYKPPFDRNVHTDLAVLSVDASDKKMNPTYYEFLTIAEINILLDNLEPEIILAGFPDLRDNNYIFPDKHKFLKCHLSRTVNETESTHVFITSLNNETLINPNDAYEELSGVSGGGLFIIIEEQVYLCGIHRGSPTENVSYGDLQTVSVDGILEVLSKNNLSTPDQTKLMPNNLHRQLEYCKSFLRSEDDEGKTKWNPISKWVTKIISENPEGIIKTSCQKSENCPYGAYFYACDIFQQQYLLGCCLLAFHNNEPPEKSELIIKNKSGKAFPAYIICNADEKQRYATAMAKSVIRSLKEDMLGNIKIQNNSMILWATKSNCQQNKAVCKKEQYNRIVPDISEANEDPFVQISKVDASPIDLTIVNILCAVDSMLEDDCYFQDIVDDM